MFVILGFSHMKPNLSFCGTMKRRINFLRLFVFAVFWSERQKCQVDIPVVIFQLGVWKGAAMLHYWMFGLPRQAVSQRPLRLSIGKQPNVVQSTETLWRIILKIGYVEHIGQESGIGSLQSSKSSVSSVLGKAIEEPF